MATKDSTKAVCGEDCSKHTPCVTPDGECVCSGCGAVLDDNFDDMPDVNLSALQELGQRSKVSLFVSRKLGGRELDGLPGLSTARSIEIANRDTGMRKRKNARAYLSRFSNACSKLGLTQAESEHAWQLFARLYGDLESGRRIINTSEIACYAIAAGVVSTRRQILGERQVAIAVTFAFHSKSVRDLYCIRRIIETRSESVTGIAKPVLTQSLKWIRGRY